MRSISVVFTFVFCLTIGGSISEARTRAPKTENEKSLLYWRYLCENQPQVESIKTDYAANSPIELTCPSQNWKILSDGDRVREVIEDAKK